MKSFLDLIKKDDRDVKSTEFSKISTEVFLYYERIRTKFVGGIVSYSINNRTNSLLFSSATQIYFYQVYFI